MYSSRIGQWLSEDPDEFLGNDPNLRRNVWNNPLSFIDPTGLEGESPKPGTSLDERIQGLIARSDDAARKNGQDPLTDVEKKRIGDLVTKLHSLGPVSAAVANELLDNPKGIIVKGTFPLGTPNGSVQVDLGKPLLGGDVLKKGGVISLPGGGKVGLPALPGELPRTDDETAAALILGHEIGHSAPGLQLTDFFDPFTLTEEQAVELAKLNGGNIPRGFGRPGGMNQVLENSMLEEANAPGRKTYIFAPIGAQKKPDPKELKQLIAFYEKYKLPIPPALKKLAK